METVFLIECDDLRLVDGINDDETATGLVAAGIEPSFDELQSFAANALSGELTAYAKATYQHARVSAEGFFVVGEAFHVVATATWQVVNTDTVVYMVRAQTIFVGSSLKRKQ